jgi:hypothetical protein
VHVVNVAQYYSYELRHPKDQMLKATFAIQANERSTCWDKADGLGLSSTHVLVNTDCRVHSPLAAIWITRVFTRGDGGTAGRQREGYQAQLQSRDGQGPYWIQAVTVDEARENEVWRSR